MSAESAAIDEIDQEIIRVLQEDGRMSFGEIGRRVGLSEPAARQRVHRLRRDGVIKIMAFADPVALGLRRAAMLVINVDGDLRAAAASIARFSQVEFVAITGGSHDVIAEVQCADEAQMLDLISAIRSEPLVRRVECLNYFHIEKQDFGFLLHEREGET
jgi:Lrp/AsnC family transcriptional regulator, regulator for asnA, asnC and gidA